MALRYRLWQFWKLATAAPLSAVAWQEIEAALTPQELALFRRYRASDRRHAYRVMQTLVQNGRTHPALLAAALLHDVGKSHLPLRFWERALVVVGSKVFPRRAVQWGAGTPGGWRRPFTVKQQHAAWGAEMAAAAGSIPLTVSLIRRHQDTLPAPPAGLEDQLLAALQWADDRS